MDSVKEPTPPRRRMDVVFSDNEQIEKDDFEHIEALTKSTNKLASALDTSAYPTSIDSYFSYEGSQLSNIILPDSIRTMIESSQKPNILDQITIDYAREPETSFVEITVQLHLTEVATGVSEKPVKRIINCSRPDGNSADCILDVADTDSISNSFPLISEEELYRMITSIVTRDNHELADFIHLFDEQAFRQYIHNPLSYDDIAKLLDQSASLGITNAFYSIEDPVTMLPVTVQTRKVDAEFSYVDFDLATGLDGESWIKVHSEQSPTPIVHAFNDEDSDFFANDTHAPLYTPATTFRQSNLTFTHYVTGAEEAPYNPTVTDFDAIMDIQKNIVDKYS